LELVGNASGGELEGVDSPLEVAVPVRAPKRQSFTNSRFVDLDGADPSFLEIDNLITEGESELLGLQLP